VPAAGRHLAALPVDAKIGKLLVLGCALGCLGPVLSAAAAASHKSPFSAPFEQQDAAQRARQALAAPGMTSGTRSDRSHACFKYMLCLWQHPSSG